MMSKRPDVAPGAGFGAVAESSITPPDPIGSAARPAPPPGGRAEGSPSPLVYFAAFLAGFVSTLVFHQGLLTILSLAGAVPRVPYDLRPTAPFGIPAVLSLAFWGGVWGAALWPVLRHARGGRFWWRAIALGALAPSAVALLIVMPLKGMPVAGGFDPRLIVGALLLNGSWGLGVAVFMRLLVTRRRPACGP